MIKLFMLLLQIMISTEAVTLNGSSKYAIPGKDFTLICDVTDEATSVSFYRRPLQTQSPQEVQVIGDQCYITVNGNPVLCTPDVCSCQSSSFQYASLFRLVINPIPGDHHSIWFCRRQNANLTNEFEDSPDYQLLVLEQVTSVSLQIQPPPLTEHQTIPLRCVTSSCRPAASVLWSVGGVNFTSSSTSSISPAFLSYVTVSRLTLTLTKAMDGQYVVCSAYNTVSSIVSDTTTLAVEYGPDTSVSLSATEDTYTGNEGDTLPDITCAADCKPGCTFVWTRPDNTNFTASPVLSLGQLDRSERGAYVCTARNDIGESNKTYSLYVRYPPSQPLITPLSASYRQGVDEYSVLLCSFTEGFPAPARVEWVARGVDTGVTTPAVILWPLRQSANGEEYFCHVRNEFTDIKGIQLISPTYYFNVTCKY
ncbi:V-set and immunoglobulin domain-containing protein 10-like 2 [Pecten maximus]|uniref:V-set and immunoglobulin domain-containing protein 10-like 2 n=1 Tax=Pecten maximus TaxID=6579 RepID=UPI00145840DE|nr:V-set and immunoglobulin domain-containing protein 10-like 2 [Pecten maximus]XP_033758737.1 V-set and immunoglobulin domain-containing protein 10-like 2 [Pecten maximus]XP_033758738.1 V-set and immunoglobulin domain-containing protein 10-like 2 [Pecten maximus]XP_033758739.1 V-set and immunoglobulin domain-containing protein 10-like 2 [Pecten maximus]